MMPQQSAPVAPPSPARNVAGRIGLIAAIVTVAYDLFAAMMSSVLPMQFARAGFPMDLMSVVYTVTSVLGLLLAIATLVFGIIGATRRGLPMLEAGIALGVGGAGVLAGFAGFLTPVFASLTYGY